jgi:phosphate:Na+ symporter
MGQNIGTCITAVLSAIGASKNAKRAAMLHLYFNLIGTLIFMVAFYFLNSVIGFAFMGASASAAGIAVIHSLFNIGCAIVLFPFTNLLLKLATYTIPDREQEAAEETALERPRALMALDERFLEKPAFAMALCRRAAIHMAEEVRTSIFLALNMISEYNEDNAIRVAELEQLVDLYEDRLGTYLVKLSGRDLSINDSRSMSILLHCISDFERMSDHAANIKDSLSKMKKKKLAFSPKARAELEVLTRAVHDIVEATCQVFAANDVEGAKHIEPLEEVIDRLNVKLRQHHVKRLRKGKCTIELGIVLEDIITDLERISDHCSNVAVCLIQVNADGFDTHEYLDIDMKESEAFKEEVRTMREQYRLPGNG